MIVLVNFIGSTIVIPVLPLYAQGEFQASPEAISLLYASFFIAQFLASPLLGRLSDRYGRRPVLLISQLGTAASFLLMALAGAFPLLFAARVLDGVTGGNVIVAQAYLTDITTKEQRTRALDHVGGCPRGADKLHDGRQVRRVHRMRNKAPRAALQILGEG